MNKRILKLAIPNIISNLTVPLLSSVDTALMGHLNEIYYLGAIAVGGMIFNFIYWGFGFLRMGTTGLTAQAFGKKDDRQSISILGRAIFAALGFSIMLIILKNFVIDTSFMLIDTSPEVEEYARKYFSIRIFAAPATLSLYAISGWFLGMQNARYPLILALVTNIFNVIFNLIFIKYFSMNVDGVALGTLCANYLGLVIAAILLTGHYRDHLKIFKFKSILNAQLFIKFFKISGDIFLRTLLLIFVFSFFTAMSAKSGDLILGANTILINLWTIMAYGIDGFAFAAESLIGRYIGARDSDELIHAIQLSFVWGVGLGLFFSCIYFLFPEWIIRIFTDKNDVIEMALYLMIWTQFAPVLGSFCYIWDGIYIGATATAAMRNSMIISVSLFFLPVYFLSKEALGVQALWLALTTFILSRGVLLAIYFRKSILRRIV
jgi:MATE family multidrug resistance protein